MQNIFCKNNYFFSSFLSHGFWKWHGYIWYFESWVLWIKMNKIHLSITLDLVRIRESIIAKLLNNKRFEWILKILKPITMNSIKIFKI